MTVLKLTNDVTRAQQNLLKLWDNKLKQLEWKPGEYIGSDLALSEQFGFSRTVVRGALDFLQKSECISRVPRRGVKLNKTFSLDLPGSQGRRLEKILFIRWADDTFTLDILSGILEQASKSGFEVVQRMANQNEEILLQTLEKIPADCTCVALAPMETPEQLEVLQELVGRGMKVVQFDRYIEGLQAPAVVFDNYQGGMLATRHLLARHPQPVYYFGLRSPVSVLKRYEGWRDAMLNAGFLNIDQYLIPGIEDDKLAELKPFDVFAERCSRPLMEFLAGVDGPVSIFVMHDAWGRLVYEAASQLELQIGKDVFIVGFDDLEMCERLSPTMTSVSVSRHQLGIEAVKLLTEIGHSYPGDCRILPVELKIRESS